MFFRTQHPILPTVSIIVPTYNGGEDFRRCLLALTQLNPLPLEIIVVSDGCTNGTWSLAQDFGMTVVRCCENAGPALARNIGAHYASGDILFFVDADVVVPQEIIRQIQLEFVADPALDALIGSYDAAPGATNFLSQYRNLLHHFVHQTGSEQASTFWGACGGIRRNLFLQVGGFDERYRRPCIEDIELGYRLKSQQARIKLCKSIQVKHLKCWRPLSMLKADVFYRALPWTALILRDQYLINDLNLTISSRVSVILIYAACLNLGLAFWWPLTLLITLSSLTGLLVLNRTLYRFFVERKGILFTLRVLPWHWLYFIYSGLAFAIGYGRYWGYRSSTLPTRAIQPLHLELSQVTVYQPLVQLQAVREESFLQ